MGKHELAVMAGRGVVTFNRKSGSTTACATGRASVEDGYLIMLDCNDMTIETEQGTITRTVLRHVDLLIPMTEVTSVMFCPEGSMAGKVEVMHE